MSSKFLLLGCSMMLAGVTMAQRPNVTISAGPGGAPAGDSSKKAPARTGPKAFKEVITDKAKAQKGFLNVYSLDEKYFLEIGDNILGRDLLIVSRLSKASSENTGSYAGDAINENVVRFEKGPDNKIFLRLVSSVTIGRDSTEGMYKNVQRSNVFPIAQAFPIAAFGENKKSSVVDITAFINGDNDVLYFDSRRKRSVGISMMQADRSYVESVKAFAKNVEIKAVKTYSPAPPSGAAGAMASMFGASTTPVTLEVNSSIVLLPEKPMKARYFDDRVGYFTTRTLTDFDANPQGIERYNFIARYRLEPKPEDVEKYRRGELVEPQKQIVYYIDPTTPKKWIPYLIQGVNDWNVAFEAAGWKNAIVGKLAPTAEEDSTFSLEDASHSAIVYKPSDIPNASGPHVHDPRSGEIIESHVNWYHNVMLLLRNWYMVQAAPNDARARKMEFDDKLMGELIRFVSSHEIGHTLGLRHNFGSSSTVPVEKLRDKAWVEANGHTPSIMDYARFNYVAQPEDNISDVGIFPRIGDYDKWAIDWGYRWFGEYADADAEKAMMNKWTIDKLKNPRLWWGDGESNRDDPRSQTEDLGDNAMKASDYGIKNLKRIIVKLPEYTKEANKDFTGLKDMYGQVTSQFGRYIGHVSRNIGGIERTPKRQEQAGPVYSYTAKTTQKDAFAWLNTNIFKTPTWVINNDITAVTGTDPKTVIGNLQNTALGNLVNARTWTNLLSAEDQDPAKTYRLSDLVSDLRGSIFTEATAKTNVDLYRRSLQKNYIDRLIALANPAPAAAPISSGGLSIFMGAGGLSKTGDGISIAKAELRSIAALLRAASPTANAITKAHYQDILDRITKALDPKQ